MPSRYALADAPTEILPHRTKKDDHSLGPPLTRYDPQDPETHHAGPVTPSMSFGTITGPLGWYFSGRVETGTGSFRGIPDYEFPCTKGGSVGNGWQAAGVVSCAETGKGLTWVLEESDGMMNAVAPPYTGPYTEYLSNVFLSAPRAERLATVERVRIGFKTYHTTQYRTCIKSFHGGRCTRTYKMIVARGEGLCYQTRKITNTCRFAHALGRPCTPLIAQWRLHLWFARPRTPTSSLRCRMGGAARANSVWTTRVCTPFTSRRPLTVRRGTFWTTKRATVALSRRTTKSRHTCLPRRSREGSTFAVLVRQNMIRLPNTKKEKCYASPHPKTLPTRRHCSCKRWTHWTRRSRVGYTFVS